MSENEKKAEAVLSGKRMKTPAEEVEQVIDNQAKAVAPTGNVTLTVEQLKEIMNASMTGVADILAKALIESKKPYVDPKSAENDANMRESMRKVKDRMDADIKKSQEICQHFQGSNELSEFQGQLTSIIQHRLDTGAVVGICTNCLREFWPSDADYLTQMRRKSGNRMSSAGQRFFLDPAAVQRAGR